MNPTPASTLFAQVDRPLWVVTAAAGSQRGGLIATFVSEASIVPELPRVVVGLARQHYTWELVEASGAFALHLLRDDQLDCVWRFGLSSGRHLDKLAGLAATTGVTGSPLLSDSLGWLDCRVEAQLETGDRTLYLAEVLQAHQTGSGTPLTFQRLLQQAPPENLQELRQQLNHDSRIDAAAIHAWRQQLRLAEPGSVTARPTPDPGSASATPVPAPPA